MEFSLSIRSRINVSWGIAGLAAAFSGFSLAAAECSTSNLVADDSISIRITAADNSERTKKISWLIDQGLEQLLHAQLVVVAGPKPNTDGEERRCPVSAYRLTGGVEEDGDIARVTFRLEDSAYSDVRWMESYDRHAGGDLKAVADELAYLAAKEVLRVVSGGVE